MNVCIDLGNSSAKVGLMEGRRVLSVKVFRTSASWEALVGRIEGVIKRWAGGIEGVAISSVVPPLNRPLAGMVRKRTGLSPFFVGSTAWLPFRLDVPRPERLGSDRIAAAAGALVHGRRSAVIVDIGTAVTVDLVCEGSFLGGLIMAGPELQLRALSLSAAKLPRVSMKELAALAASHPVTTKRAIAAGCIAATAGAVREAVRWLEGSIATRAAKVVTGGAVASVLDRLPRSWNYDPHLVVKGINYIYELNL